MSRHKQPLLPAAPFGLLLVEGGDERAVCQAILGPAWSGLVCRSAEGRDDLPALADVATKEPNFRFVRSVGVVMDMEGDAVDAYALASRVLSGLGVAGAPAHAAFVGSAPRVGIFLAPDGIALGCIETLCRKAVSDPKLAACVDALVACAGSPHALDARADKGWLQSYLGMCTHAGLRFHQALSPANGIDPTHAAFDPLRTFLQSL